MQCSLHKGISLVMGSHQVLQRAEWHAKHVCKLARVDCNLLSLEHARLGIFKLFISRNILLVLDAYCCNFALIFFVFDVSWVEVLPFVIHLFRNQTICLFKRLSHFIIGRLLYFHLHLYEFFEQLGLSFKNLNFRQVTLFEVVRIQVDTWSLGHEVDNYLDKSLLFKSVTSVLVALQVAEDQL